MASSATAGAILEPHQALVYVVVLLAAWQAVTFVQAIGEMSPKLVQLASHVGHGRRFLLIPRMRPLALSRTVAVGLLVAVAAAKVLFDVAGYAHRLPHALGGGADLWDHGANPWVWYFTALVAVPLAVVLVRRVGPADARRSIAVPLVFLGATFALFSVAQLLLNSVADGAPELGIRMRHGTPFYLPPNTVENLTMVLLAGGLCFYWRRHRAAAALFGISLLIALPGRLNVALGTALPIPGLGRWDLVVSVAMLAWCLAYAARRAPSPPLWLTVAWLSLTLLVHSGTFVPTSLQLSLFAVAVLLPVAYTLLWDGESLNATAGRSPAEATLALAVIAMLLVVVVAQIWVGDRFGRSVNYFVTTGMGYQEGARQRIGIPLLVVLTWLAFLKHPLRREMRVG
jgi:hypothetical protein